MQPYIVCDECGRRDERTLHVGQKCNDRLGPNKYCAGLMRRPAECHRCHQPVAQHLLKLESTFGHDDRLPLLPGTERNRIDLCSECRSEFIEWLTGEKATETLDDAEG